MASKSVFILQLEEDLEMNKKLFHVTIGKILRFTLAPSLQGRRVALQCNHPLSTEEAFDRRSFHSLEWKSPFGGDGECDIEIVLSGCFNFLFKVQPANDFVTHEDLWPVYKGTFLVDPVLSIGKTTLPPSALAIQTVIPRCLGPMSEWEGRLKVTQYAGYNMVHFTPVQEIGASKSAYSIRDQCRIEPGFFPGEELSDDEALSRLKGFLTRMRQPCDEGGMGMLSVVDMVWNHTSTDSPFLKEHPEAGYNLEKYPEFIPAYVFDQGLQMFSRAVAMHYIPGVSCDIKSVEDVDKLLHACRTALQDALRLWDFFVVDVDEALREFTSLVTTPEDDPSRTSPKATDLTIKHISNGRHGMVVDMASALDVCRLPRGDGEPDDEYVARCTADLRHRLELHNLHAYERLNADMDTAFSNMRHIIEMERLDPKSTVGPITLANPMLVPLFTNVGSTQGNVLRDLSVCPLDDPEYDPRKIVIHNGWVWNSPVQEFSEPRADIYFRRDIIIWGDCVKLCYGRRPEDNPWLWQHMTQYTRQMALLFDGFRIDNCHATPIHVGQYLLDQARAVNPNLYVFAELYTSSPSSEALFSNTLGMTSIIREALTPRTPSHLSALIHYYGGRPIGSFQNLLIPTTFLHPSVPLALFYDGTHDNATPEEIFTFYANLPISGLVAMVYNAIGSSRGYDELYPTRAQVVNETKLYRSWADTPAATIPATNGAADAADAAGAAAAAASSEFGGAADAAAADAAAPSSVAQAAALPSAPTPKDLAFVDEGYGILKAKAVLNRLHERLAVEHFDEIYVDDMGDGIISITRHSPITLRAVTVVTNHAHTQEDLHRPFRGKPPIRTGGIVTNILLAAIPPPPDKAAAYEPDERFLTGRRFDISVATDIQPSACSVVSIANKPNELTLTDFPPGSVLVYEVVSEEESSGLVQAVHARLGWAMSDMVTTSTEPQEQLERIVSVLNLVDMNHALFRCKPEEETEAWRGDRAYDIPGFGTLVYNGLQGLMSVLEDVRIRNDLAHPICDDVRAHDGLMDFIARHLEGNPRTGALGLWLRETFGLIAKLPRSSIPVHFALAVAEVYDALVRRALSLMSPHIQGASAAVKELALSTVQFYGHDAPYARAPLATIFEGDGKVPGTSAGATATLPNLLEPIEIVREWGWPSMAAGLPHFAAGWKRAWGRDTFIAFRGLLLVTGRYSEARHELLFAASLLRHGLIPNLLDGGKNPRYNCRDAVWWWMQALQEYCSFSPEGTGILHARVLRRFPSDAPPSGAAALTKEQPLMEIVQEVFEKHAAGIAYREWNAGPDLDGDMSLEGFDVRIGLDKATGFIFGGSKFNCGTWMDKMGGSKAAGNKGHPATPRDGADVEIIGLLKSALRWIVRLVDEGAYPFSGVQALASELDGVLEPSMQERVSAAVDAGGEEGVGGRVFTQGGEPLLSFKHWDSLVRESFEAHFWVPEHEGEDTERIHRDLVHRRGIYKDTVGSSAGYTDYQLRPNFCVAMAVAPELFTRERAQKALAMVGELLVGGLGLRTLDPADMKYRPNYASAAEGDYDVANGFNYHQGPEWLWPVGYYLRARLIFADNLRNEIQSIQQYMSRHRIQLLSNPWRGLPELTNENGAVCPDSCPVQAWSAACMLDALYDMSRAALERL